MTERLGLTEAGIQMFEVRLETALTAITLQGIIRLFAMGRFCRVGRCFVSATSVTDFAKSSSRTRASLSVLLDTAEDDSDERLAVREEVSRA